MFKVTKSFGKKVVFKEIDNKINQGQIYGFIGPSGSTGGPYNVAPPKWKTL